MAKYIKIPFAQLGDKATIPDSPIGLEVNYTTGYTAAYEADPDTDPTARYVERDGQNQIFFVLSSNIKEWQEHLYPSFITSAENDGVPFAYEKGMIARYLGLNYISLENSNQDTPPSAKWEQFVTGTAAGRDVGTGADEIPDTEILDTRLGTTGNLGDAAQRTVGAALANVPDNTQLNARLGTSGNLGDAAQLTKQTSVTDNTADRVMTVGAFGLGGDDGIGVSNLNLINEVGIYTCVGIATAPLPQGRFDVFNMGTTQIAVSDTNGNLYHRGGSGAWLGSYAGRIDRFATSTAPAGYLATNGAAVSRVTYKELFDVIGTTYGAGDGLTTFNVPNDTDPTYNLYIKY